MRRGFECLVLNGSVSPSDVVLVGCCGSKTKPIGMCELNMTVYGCTVQVPTLVVDGQADDLIVGINVIKHLIKELKKHEELMDKMTSNVKMNSEDGKLIQLLANVERWNGTVVPEKVGTVILKNSVTLEPLQEHLVWAKLSNLKKLSAGSAIIAEPCRARSRPRNILIGRTVARLWADGWVPVKVINPSPVSITLRRNAMLADIYPCLALEDFDPDASVTNIGLPYTIKQHTDNVVS